jgi:hypothetical protein
MRAMKMTRSVKAVLGVVVAVLAAFMVGVGTDVALGATIQNKYCPSTANFICPGACIGAGREYACLGTLNLDILWGGGTRRTCVSQCNSTCNTMVLGCPYQRFTSTDGTCTGEYTNQNANCWEICGT